jgi:hypothetical protein
MLYFPQLATGAGSQFPVTRRAVRRTVVNAAPDGRMVKLADAGAASVEWQLSLAGLTGEEWGAIESVFEGAEGRLKSFTFLDPTDNLLVWSEDLSQVTWVKDAGLELTAGVADPAGTTRATRIGNSGGSALTIRQTLEIPGWYQYCFSVWTRSATPGDAWLWRTSAAGLVKKQFKTWGAWNRLAYSTKVSDTSETVSFGLELGAAGVVEVFGLQLEAQRGASKYKKTASRGGVWREAYFQDDALRLTSAGPGEHSGVVRIRAGQQG